MPEVPTITLNNGVEIPQLGFGVFQIEPARTKEATLAALEVGYRHIDTAEMYGNEKEVGEAVRESGLDRGGGLRHQQAQQRLPRARRRARARSTRRSRTCGFDYLDLFLIHWPLPEVGRLRRDVAGAWRRSTQSGRARSIGVSNFQPHHLRRLHAGDDDRCRR